MLVRISELKFVEADDVIAVQIAYAPAGEKFIEINSLYNVNYVIDYVSEEELLHLIYNINEAKSKTADSSKIDYYVAVSKNLKGKGEF